MTFPRNVGQCPIYYNRYGTGRPREDDSRRCWCQSAYIDSPNAPLYPFGYGLSYTEFTYGKPYVDKTVLQSGGDDCITVCCELANTGKYDGKEVVQMYVRDMVGSVVRPVRELKGFKKVFVKRGEKVVVSFTIREEDLAFYNAKLEKRAEKGAFRVWIGGDSTCSEYVEFELV
jgi:beta-glucosidase